VRYLVFERVGLPLLASVPFSLPPPYLSLSLSLFGSLCDVSENPERRASTASRERIHGGPTD